MTEPDTQSKHVTLGLEDVLLMFSALRPVLEAAGLEITPLGENARLAEKLKAVEYDAHMAAGAWAEVHRLLDEGGIPRGTFADEHVKNLVARYNAVKAERDEALADAALYRSLSAFMSAQIAKMRDGKRSFFSS